MTNRLLDHIDGLELTDEGFDDHYEARMALARLAEGLFWVNEEVKRFELRTRSRAREDNTEFALAGGILDEIPVGLLSCAFQWYAVSACNYAQLVGWLATGDTGQAKQYVKSVMPTLLNYRNKVAAHFAITDPRRDNEADLMASVMTQVVFTKGYLSAAALTQRVTRDGIEIGASRKLSWSLTRTHERLVERYWPGGPPRATQALRVPPNTTVSIDVQMPDDALGEG